MKLTELKGARVLLAPYNDRTVLLRRQLPPDVRFLGWVDSVKQANSVFSPATAPPADVVIIDSPLHWRSIASAVSAPSVFLHDRIGRELFEVHEYVDLLDRGLAYDVLMAGFNRGGVRALEAVARCLQSEGLTAAIVDLSSSSDAVPKTADGGVPRVPASRMTAVIRRAVVAVVADGIRLALPLLEQERACGGSTIGLVVSSGAVRDALSPEDRTACGLLGAILLEGEADLDWLGRDPSETAVVGHGSVWHLHRQEAPRPAAPLVLVDAPNDEVGDETRRAWALLAVEGCRQAGIPCVLARPEPGVAPSQVAVSPFDLRSSVRAASVVVTASEHTLLEALALGREAVHFGGVPPRVTTDLAWGEARGPDELAAALRGLTDESAPRRAAVRRFLEHRCAVASTVSPERLAAYRIRNLATDWSRVALRPRDSFELGPSYSSWREYRHHDDREFEDQWQLEVYLHALGLMVHHGYTRVADVGCGSGFKLIHYLGQYQTVGYEVPVNVEALRHKYPDRDWRPSSFEDVGIIDTDVVVCSDVIEHLINPDDLMTFLQRQRFSHLLLSTPDRKLLYPEGNAGRYGPPRNPAHQREWSFGEFRRYVERFFEVVDHRITNHHQATQLITCRLR